MPQIVINDITPRIQYYASAGQTRFDFPWPMFYPTDIQVYKRPYGSEPNDVVDILTYVTDYTVTIFPAPAVGGYITLNTGAVSQDIITLARAQPDQRLNYYINGGPFPAPIVNADFDSIVMMDQQRQMYDEVIGVHYNVNAVVEPVVDNILPVLPPLCVWMKNQANTKIIPVPFSGGGGGGGNALIVVITQPGHGFTGGQVVYSNAGTFALARADSAVDAEVIGLVESVIDSNNFNLLVSGEVSALTGLTPGGVYFLSDTVAGELTLTQPTTTGHISKPLLIATDASTGFFYNFRGKIINGPSFPWTPISADTQLTANENYYTTGGGVLNLTLPVSCSAGSVIRIKGYGSTGWKIVQNSGQSIVFGNQVTTVGVTGYIESQLASDDIELLCVVANTTFTVLGAPLALNLTVN